MIRVCVAGATGRTGQAVAEAVRAEADLELVCAVARRGSGQDLGVAWGGATIGVPVHASVEEALGGVDVFVDYTSYEVVKRHVLGAVTTGVHVVVGSSGLTADDYAELDAAARAAGVGVFAAGNFSVTATLQQQLAALAARHLPDWEIVDYASHLKPDSPSGTARELAEHLAQVASPAPYATPTGDGGPARGALVAGRRIHSVRLPSYELSTEVVFGLADERLVITHVANPNPGAYVRGTLLAIRSVVGSVGVVRGLAPLLLGGPSA